MTPSYTREQWQEMQGRPYAEEIAKAKKHLYDLLLSPYNESSHYQITTACAYLNHPMRPPRKFQENQRCICGMKKGLESA